MKCPRCGHEMIMDDHRKIDMFMCYDCGYIEGREVDSQPPVFSSGRTNYERLRSMNLNEAVAFISAGLQVDKAALAAWLDSAAV